MIGIFSTAQDLLCDTASTAILQEILWGFVNSFHRKLDQIERELDDNEVAQRRSQSEQDSLEDLCRDRARTPYRPRQDAWSSVATASSSFAMQAAESLRGPTPAWSGAPAWDR